MKRFLGAVICIVLLIGLVGCKVEKEEKLKTIDEITMTVKEGSLTKTSMIIHVKEKDIKRVVYGESFIIEQKVNNKWKEVKTINDNYGFNSMAYYTNYNGVLEMYQDWSHIYGKLDKGKYRLVKDVFYESDIPITEEDKYYIYVEFEIK